MSTVKHGRAIAREIDVSGLSNAPRQERSQKLSIRILEAAENVLRRDGAQGFTIGAVAAEAQVSIGGIYGRFTNREELLTAIHGAAIDRIRHHLEGALQRPFTSLDEVAQEYATQVVYVFRSFGDLLPAVSGSANMSTVNQAERAIRTALWQAVQPFKAEMGDIDHEIAVRMAVHLTLASVTRERMSPASATERLMGWDTLAAELPRVVRSILKDA